MTMQEITGRQLLEMMQNNRGKHHPGFVDAGAYGAAYHAAVEELREAGHVIGVGTRFEQSDGNVSQVIAIRLKDSQNSESQFRKLIDTGVAEAPEPDPED